MFKDSEGLDWFEVFLFLAGLFILFAVLDVLGYLLSLFYTIAPDRMQFP